MLLCQAVVLRLAVLGVNHLHCSQCSPKPPCHVAFDKSDQPPPPQTRIADLILPFGCFFSLGNQIRGFLERKRTPHQKSQTPAPHPPRCLRKDLVPQDGPSAPLRRPLRAVRRHPEAQRRALPWEKCKVWALEANHLWPSRQTWPQRSLS